MAWALRGKAGCESEHDDRVLYAQFRYYRLGHTAIFCGTIQLADGGVNERSKRVGGGGGGLNGSRSDGNWTST